MLDITFIDANFFKSKDNLVSLVSKGYQLTAPISPLEYDYLRELPETNDLNWILYETFAVFFIICCFGFFFFKMN